MRKKIWIFLGLFFIFPGLMLTASCSKKKVKMEEAVYDSPLSRQSAPRSITSEQERLAQQQAIDEERLRQQRLLREEEERRRRAEISGGTSGSIYKDTMGNRRKIMSDDIYFSYDSSILSPQAQETLRQKAELLRANPNLSLVIEGHCDERGTNEYNMALGDRRARSTKSFLVNMGIHSSRLTPISYGEERPAVSGHNEASWAKNRRVHFVVE